MIELFLGGARSGKSRIAETRALHCSEQEHKQVIYVATAKSQDSEMQQRIKQHQNRRPEHWVTREEPIALASLLAEHNDAHYLVMIDCLTLWLTNLLCHADPDRYQQEKNALLHQLAQHRSNVIIVSNETGLGIVPMGELTRRFVDESGWLHQEIAALADEVTLVIAGLTHSLKTTTQTKNS